jgi:orotidine-5'-phosphate decarboxylase
MAGSKTHLPEHSDSLDRLIVALDVSSAAEAKIIVDALGDSVKIFKVGMQLYTAEGPHIVRELVSSGKEVFLDLKYHDIPNTVASAVREAAQLGVSMLTVHASGGAKMLAAAVEAARTTAAHVGPGIVANPSTAHVGAGALTRPNTHRDLKILAVTVLTSLDENALNEIGVSGRVVDQVVRLASLALRSGCSGIVSSAQEVSALRAKLGSEFLAVTPGVRPAGADHGDQARVVTPAAAIAAGATHIVVGRPITAAKDPGAAASSIQQEITQALADRHSAKA